MTPPSIPLCGICSNFPTCQDQDDADKDDIICLNYKGAEK